MMDAPVREEDMVNVIVDQTESVGEGCEREESERKETSEQLDTVPDERPQVTLKNEKIEVEEEHVEYGKDGAGGSDGENVSNQSKLVDQASQTHRTGDNWRGETS